MHQILTDAGFRQISIDPRSHEVEVAESAVVDDAQLSFMGVSDDAMDDARSAVASMMGRFATGDELCRFPLAFQIVTAQADN